MDPDNRSHVLCCDPQVGRNGEDVEGGGLGEVPSHSALPLRSNPAMASKGLSFVSWCFVGEADPLVNYSITIWKITIFNTYR